MNVAVLVPRRADNGRRDHIWRFVRERWRSEHPDLTVVEGTHDGTTPFNRSLAINRAADKAGAWDIAIVADSDTICAKEQIETAIDVCALTGHFTLAYTRWVSLNREMSDKIINDGWTGDWWPGADFTMTDTCSSMVVVTRKVFDECRGFDEVSFDKGWGCEDYAFAHAARTFSGGGERLPGEAWHLAHDPAPRLDVPTHVERASQYSVVAGDRAAMRTLIDRIRGAEKVGR